MAKGKVGFSVKGLAKALDGLKYRDAPPATADSIARKLGSRIWRAKEIKPSDPDNSAKLPFSNK